MDRCEGLRTTAGVEGGTMWCPWSGLGVTPPRLEGRRGGHVPRTRNLFPRLPVSLCLGGQGL